MPSIVFYISSHGFGHSTRAMEVIANLPNHIDVTIVTAASEWLFQRYLTRPFHYRKLDHDCGVVQPDSLGTDTTTTLSRWNSLLENYPKMAESEATTIQKEGASLVVGDISPFAVAVAQQAGLSSVITANFCWNWIFEEYQASQPEFSAVIDQISNYYRKTDYLLRTPLSDGLSVFPHIVDIPMIVRTSKRTREDMRREWGVSDDQPVALLSFGGMGVNGLIPEMLRRYPHWTFLTFDSAFESVENAIYFEPSSIYHPDLVNAVDLVIAKLGYGLNTECIAHQTPMVYVPREGFREFGVLERDTAKHIPMVRIESDRFFQGDWDEIDPFYGRCEEIQKTRNPPLASDGGQAAAEFLIGLIDRQTSRVVQSA